MLDEEFMNDLKDSDALGDVWILEEVEDGRELSQDKGSTLTLFFLRM